MKALLSSIGNWFTEGMTSDQVFFATKILPLLVIILLVALVAKNFVTWSGTTKGEKISRLAGLLGLAVLMTVLWFWLVHWLSPEQAHDVVSNATDEQTRDKIFNWGWRLGLSGVVVVLTLLGISGFKNLFIDKRYLKKEEKGEQPSIVASFCGLILTAICGLMIIWLPGMWFFSLVLLICAWILSGVVIVPLNELCIPSMFNEMLRDNSDLLSKAKVVKILNTGITINPIQLWLSGFQLTRLRNDFEVVNKHLIEAKLSTKTPESSSSSTSSTDPGTRISFCYNVTWQYNEHPWDFLHLSPEDQANLQKVVLSAIDAFVQTYVKTVVYQDLENWHPKEGDEFFQKLTEILKRFGVLLSEFEVVNIESSVETQTDALADEHVRQQIEDLKVAQANIRQLRIAENENKALDLRVVGVLRTMGLSPETATPAQREQALAQLRANEIATKDYLIPPGTQSGTGLNIAVQAPPSSTRR